MTNAPRGLLVTKFPLPTDAGGPKRTVRLIEAMQRAGAHPYVLTEEPVDPDALSEARGLGWTVEVVPKVGYRFRRARQVAHRWGAPCNPVLRQRVRDLAPSMAFAQFEEIYYTPYIFDAVGRCKTIASLHNVDSSILLTRARDGALPPLRRTLMTCEGWNMVRSERAVAAAADAVIVVSESDQQYHRGSNEETVLAPNGADETLFRVPLPARGKRILFFGNFAWAPNVDGLLRFMSNSWPRIRAKVPEASLAVAGPCIQSRLSVGSEPGVDIVGLVPYIAGELGRCLFTVAPLWAASGTRIKVLESLAAGRAVVGTSLGVEQVGFVSGCHGLIGDTDEELADAAIRLLQAPQLAAEMGRRGRAHARAFEWSSALRPCEDLYRRWLAPSNNGRKSS